MKRRVSAIIIRGGKILLIRRVKPEEEYHTFPGGTVEESESVEEAIMREVREEISVQPTAHKLLFKIESPEREDHYFLIESFTGTPALGGPELARVTDQNRYHLVWKDREEFRALENIYPNPQGAKDRILLFWEQERHEANYDHPPLP